MKRIALTFFAAVVSGPVLAAPYQSVQARQMIGIADRVQAAHPSHNYGDLTPAGVSAGQVKWGPVVAFTGPLPDVPSTLAFGLNVSGVPRSECVAFVAAAAPRFSDVWIAGDRPTDVGVSVYSHGHLSHSKLARACAAHSTLGMDFISP